MEGIHILNQTEIMSTPSMWKTLVIIAIITSILSLIFIAICEEYEWDIARLGGITILILSTICFLIGFVVSMCTINTIHTGRYRYEVTVDDDITFDEIMDKYDVVEQRGEIWVLEDKEE